LPGNSASEKDQREAGLGGGGSLVVTGWDAGRPGRWGEQGRAAAGCEAEPGLALCKVGRETRTARARTDSSGPRLAFIYNSASRGWRAKLVVTAPRGVTLPCPSVLPGSVSPGHEGCGWQQGEGLSALCCLSSRPPPTPVRVGAPTPAL